jgi:hypothetical protein
VRPWHLLHVLHTLPGKRRATEPTIERARAFVLPHNAARGLQVLNEVLTHEEVTWGCPTIEVAHHSQVMDHM